MMRALRLLLIALVCLPLLPGYVFPRRTPPAGGLPGPSCAGFTSDFCEDFETGNWCCHVDTSTAVCTAATGNDDATCDVSPYATAGAGVLTGLMDGTTATDGIWFDEVTVGSDVVLRIDKNQASGFREGGLLEGSSFVTGGEEVQLAACFRLNSESLADGDQCGVLGFHDATGNGFLGIALTQVTGTLRFYNESTQAATTDPACTGTAVALNTWYQLNIIYIDFDSATGDAHIYIDGTEDTACQILDTDLGNDDQAGLKIGDVGANVNCIMQYDIAIYAIDRAAADQTPWDLNCDGI